MIWKVYSWIYVPAHRPFWISLSDIDIYSGMREGQKGISDPALPERERKESVEEVKMERSKKWYDYPKTVVTALF